jgi:orotidine-5'-phosphate decarboxylase
VKHRIFVALDTGDINQALNIAKEIKNYISGVKLGLEFFTKNGRKGIETFSKLNIPIFLDLKFFDIKNTVIKAIKTLDGLPINYLSIHLLNGKDTLIEAKKTVNSFTNPIRLLGVTVLTSFSDENLKEVGINNSSLNQVSLLADLAKISKIDGIVCASNEIKTIKNISSNFEIFVPGVRLKENDDDQKRISTPLQAIKNGADFLVIGRPITKGDPLKNIKEIINSLN